ncbi:MAG TPA: S8 family serine peptidase, partial [Acidobacteriota bacterium]|nr:S8 family serine peptidase [Acidobacteriota bacterium]
MNPQQITTAQKPRILLSVRYVTGPMKFFARLLFGAVVFALSFNTLFAQAIWDAPGTHRPAHRLSGGSLTTLQSTPLRTRPAAAVGNTALVPGQVFGQSSTDAEFAQGRILVSFKEGTSSNEKRDILSRASRELQLASDSTSRYFDVIQIAGDGISAEEAIARLRTDPRVRIAEPDYVVHTQDNVPNDPHFKYLWGLQNLGQGSYGSSGCTTCSKPGADIAAAQAWDLTTGSSDVIVAVIDTGVDYSHPDLAANILRDGAGKVVGYDFVNKDDDPMDDYGHGTHCAGPIGAGGNNGIGVAGVCWNVKIMPLKFLDASGGGYTSDAVSCVDFAISHGAHILSNSWGGGGFSQLLLDAIRRAEKAGILFVAAAGNSAMSIDPGGFYPANYNRMASNVIAVAATDDYDILASFSNYGPKTCDIAAPGASIYSTLPTGNCPLCSPSGYGYLSGTSMATPHVAGAAALIRSLYPRASLTELRARLIYSAEHPAEMEGYTRKGRLNVFNAMQSDAVPPGTPSDFSISQASGTGLRLTWTASGENGPSGTVSAYQIFYNTISDMTTAEMLEPGMIPGPPGTLETVDLMGLVPNTVYYVGIRSVDKVGNTSSLISAAPVLTNSADFFDSAESTLAFGTDYGPSWTVGTDDAHTGQHSYTSPAGLSANQSSTLQMTGTFSPRGPAYLAFWTKMDLDYPNDFLGCMVQEIDTGNGEYHSVGSGSSGWARYRFDLSRHAGHAIKIGFVIYRGGKAASSASHRAWIDDVAIVQLTQGLVDDVEGTAQFTGFPPWSVTTESSASLSHAWSDSPQAVYANNVRLPLMQNSSMSAPGGLGALSLVFKAKIDLEANRDYLEIYASPDDGASWEYLGALTGTADWTTYSYDLSGWKKVRALFYLVSNEVITRDGVYIDDIGIWGESFTTARAAISDPQKTATVLPVPAGGANAAATGGNSGTTQSGYATVDISSGGTPYGTAVMSITQGNIVVSEAAVTTSPPTTAARVFIDYRTGAAEIYTGLAIVNQGLAAANITYILRNPGGVQLAVGHGTLASGAHIARFIHQLRELAPDFNLPSDFATSVRFGSLEIDSDLPLSVTALRLTVNQRGDPLLTTTPVVDLNGSSVFSPVYFPQFADGAGYLTTIILVNTSNTLEIGTIDFWGDDGTAVNVLTDAGASSSSFSYSIQAGGVFVLQTIGAGAGVLAGSVQVTPTAGTPTPSGAGIFSYSSGGIKITESGVPAAFPTRHAHIFIDQSLGHETGLAIAAPTSRGIDV